MLYEVITVLSITAPDQSRHGFTSLFLCIREYRFQVRGRRNPLAIDLQQDVAAMNTLGGDLAARCYPGDDRAFQGVLDLELAAQFVVERCHRQPQLAKTFFGLCNRDGIAT